MSGGDYGPMRPVRATSMFDDKSEMTTEMSVHAKAAPTFTLSPPADAPPARQSPASESPSTIKLVVPVAHAWNAAAVTNPKVAPLAAPLAKLGYNGKTAHVSQIKLLSTTSNAPGPLKGVLKSVLPPAAGSANEHVVGKLTDAATGAPSTYIIPPGHHKHDEVLYQNVLPTGTTIDLARHAKIDPASLTANVADNPALSNVMVFEALSPKLHAMLEANLESGKFQSATSGVSGDKKFIDISRAEYQKFLDNYKQTVHAHIPKTDVGAHNVTLEDFSGAAGTFGNNVAESAVHAHEREQFATADTQHQVVSVLEYELTPHE